FTEMLLLVLLVCTIGTTTAQLEWNYNEILNKSILFYEIQRSGRLPANNRIPWRGDSALNDGQDVGHDLSGGWYDAGDHVKFGLPMALATTTLLYGLIEFEQAYRDAGQYDIMLDSVKWSLDYMLKCHTIPGQQFFGQVGDGHVDHSNWGRPEDMTMERPSFQVNTTCGGSEVAGETAAAMAAGSIAFRAVDSAYADTLLTNSRQLYTFANTYRRTYHECIPNVLEFYRSWSGYMDELLWSAAWLYRATNDAQYLTAARSHYQSGHNTEYSWDNKWVGGYLLMWQLTGEEQYSRDFQGFMNRWLPGGGITYTPGGLAWHQRWGVLRYNAHTCFLGLVAAKLGLNEGAYRIWAAGQIDYILGDNPRGSSYVCGFGNNPPVRPHHSSTSCPPRPATCGWDDFHSPDPNPHTLWGALVGGPDENDAFQDLRNDYVKNEVTTEYNSGFQSAIAGLKYFENRPLP
ncbi:unnamed protein product, partial [Owenia fusiformis]